MDNKFTANESYKISNEIMKKKLKMDNTEGTITTNASSKLSEILAKIKKSNDFYEETEERIEKRKFRDYLEYCRKNVKPKISKDVMDVLSSFYLEEKTKNNTFVTKTLETLMNLSEAYAKLHMRNEVTEKDAQFVIKYFKVLNKTTKDEAEETQTKKAAKISECLEEFIIENGRKIILKEELWEIIKTLNVKQSINIYIEMLNYKGILVKNNANEYTINI